jgi:sulfur carrier protein
LPHPRFKFQIFPALVVPSMASIEFNGQVQQVEESTTILDLLHKAGVEPRFCAVEVNLEILPKPQYASRRVQEGDRIEVVTLVGGG